MNISHSIILIPVIYFTGVIAAFFSVYIVNKVVVIEENADNWYTPIDDIEIIGMSWLIVAVSLYLLLYYKILVKIPYLPLPKKLQSIKNYINKFIINF
jgi:hypothetical protein